MEGTARQAVQEDIALIYGTLFGQCERRSAVTLSNFIGKW